MESPPSSPVSPVSPSSFDGPNSLLDNSPGALCGWLYKSTGDGTHRGTADRPKRRWFIYNVDSQVLEYYRNPKDVTKLGVIDVGEAAFLPEATPTSDHLYAMDIQTSKKTYRVYHETRATLDFWRQALQRRRSEQLELRLAQGCGDEDEDPEERIQARFALQPHLEVEARVHETNRFVGPHTHTQMQSSLTDISMRNISTEARNKFRAWTSFMRPDSDSAKSSGPPNTSANRLTKSNTATTPPITAAPAKVPRRSLAGLASTPEKLCDECRQLRGQNQDLQDTLTACKSKLLSLQTSLQLLDSPCSTEELGARVKEQEIEKENLENKIEILNEVISSKDQQIMRLQNHLAELEANPFEQEEFRNKYAALVQETSAYREQNQALNAEILNLRGLFSASVDHERKLIDAVKRLHEIYSMTILKLKKRVEELSQPQLGQSESDGLLAVDQVELLADALIDGQNDSDDLTEESLQLKNLLLTAKGQMTDEYGFYVQRREFEKQQMIDLTQLGPEVNISQYLDTPPIDHDREASIMAKWERFLDENGLKNDGLTKPVQKSPELKTLLRQGCPTRLRSRVWRALIFYYIGDYRTKYNNEKYYSDRLNANMDKFLVERKQIELDLHRSLPENCFFNIEHQPPHTLKLDALKRVLLAFCVGDSIGYCQGLDRLAAIMLLILDEEIAFWGLQVVVNHLRSPEYYTRSLRDAQVDQRVFKDLVASHVPKVSAHLATYDVDVSLFSFNWFLTIFVDGFHWSIFMKVWDAFLFEGDKVIFRYAIAVIIYLEPILLHCREVTDIYKILRNAGRYVKDHLKLTDIAFSELRSFPKRRIKQKRLHYAQIVDQEIRQVHEERERMRKRTEERSMFRMDEEDDLEDGK